MENAILSAKPKIKRARLRAKLPISLEAKVLRGVEPGKEIVRLISSGEQIDLFRGDDIDVQCSPEGKEVSVATIITNFRDVHDDLTDRGVVWVTPGDPATMEFVVNAKALESAGTLAEIAKAAEDAVKTNVFDRFK